MRSSLLTLCASNGITRGLFSALQGDNYRDHDSIATAPEFLNLIQQQSYYYRDKVRSIVITESLSVNIRHLAGFLKISETD